MKLSLSMYSCVRAVRAGKLDLMGFLDFAASQPVSGVELLDMFWTDAENEIPQVKRRLADLDLALAVYSLSNNFIQPDASKRARELADLRRGIDTALGLGVDFLRVFSGDAKQGISHEQGMEWILEGLAAGADYAQSHGATLALENHGRFAGRSDQVRDIIKRVNSPALRVNFDTGNFLIMGQDPVAAAHDLKEWVALVHLKDMKPATGDEASHVFADPNGRLLTGSVVGDGLVDLPAVMAVLREAGYTGWLSLEYEGAEEPLTVGVPRSLATARSLLA